MLQRNQINNFIRGEDYSAARLSAQELARRVPDLKSSSRTDSDNPGITLVEL